MPKEVYEIRYRVEPWGKPTEEMGEQVRPGIRVTEEWGYTDRLFAASILENGSIILLDSKYGAEPDREVLEAVRDAINHHLEHHC